MTLFYFGVILGILILLAKNNLQVACTVSLTGVFWTILIYQHIEARTFAPGFGAGSDSAVASLCCGCNAIDLAADPFNRGPNQGHQPPPHLPCPRPTP